MRDISAPKNKGGRPSKHPELGSRCGTAHIGYYEKDVQAYHIDLRMRGKTPKELPFTEWVMESCRDYFALRARGGELLSFADQKLIDIYRERAVERLTMDYEVYRSRQISWIRANLDGLHRHWPSLHAEEIFDELEDLMNREEASV